MGDSIALLVIDLQRCAFDGELSPAIHGAEDLLASASSLIAAARTAGAPVIFVQHCGTPDQLYAEGTERWVIHPSLAPEPTDLVVQKRQSSAFDGTELQRLLEGKQIDTVITCGAQSEFCVANTSLAALGLGFTVYVAEDAHSTWSTEACHASAIIERQNSRLSEHGAHVEPTTKLVELLATS